MLFSRFQHATETNFPRSTTLPKRIGFPPPLQQAEDKIGLINAANDRIVQVSPTQIAAIVSEDRMCGITLISGESYLLNKRLKAAEEDFTPPRFLRINNTTIIGAAHIHEFSSAAHARIEVLLTDGSRHTVSRFYIQQFRRNLK